MVFLRLNISSHNPNALLIGLTFLFMVMMTSCRQISTPTTTPTKNENPLVELADLSINLDGTLALQAIITSGLDYNVAPSTLFVVEGTCYQSADITITNNTGRDIHNLNFFARSDASTLGETAITKYKNAAGIAITDSAAYKAIIPINTHKLDGNKAIIASEKANLQGFKQAEIAALQSEIDAILQGNKIINYGFFVKGSTITQKGGTITAGNKGTVSLSVRYPCNGASATKQPSFVFKFAVSELPLPRITRGHNESLEDFKKRINDEFAGSPPSNLEVATFNKAEVPSGIGTPVDAGNLETGKTPTNPSSFSQQQVITSNASSKDRFGEVLVSNNNLLAASAYLKNNGRGVVYVYQKSNNGNYNSTPSILTSKDAADNDFFGRSVAISGDTIAVGAVSKDGLENNTGAVYIFKGNNGSFSQTNKLDITTASANDRFGEAVAISGKTLLVSALGKDSNTGKIYMYSNPAGNTWNLVSEFVPTDAKAGSLFGSEMILAGNRALVTSKDAVYVLQLTSNSITQVARLTGNTNYGKALDISGDTAILADDGASYVVKLTDNSSTTKNMASISDVAIATGIAAASSKTEQKVQLFNPDTGKDIETVTSKDVTTPVGFGAGIVLENINDSKVLVVAANAEGKLYVFKK